MGESATIRFVGIEEAPPGYHVPLVVVCWGEVRE
jgi:hypothetical protein